MENSQEDKDLIPYKGVLPVSFETRRLLRERRFQKRLIVNSEPFSVFKWRSTQQKPQSQDGFYQEILRPLCGIKDVVQQEEVCSNFKIILIHINSSTPIDSA
ncbi:MAG: hypothetical protein EZS28_016342 [Streblomastix strix]|uniref:Uncharacterized protein n=1 Tax=Streblomastix strix TaxID=222440 RepID=A0A5J4W0U3_9EUKA|nr:MAG: hypothetical protein EZS28_016342 [Streblomastix strix]